MCVCQVEASASGRSLVQSRPTECGVSECDREDKIMERLWPTGGGGGCCAMGRKITLWGLGTGEGIHSGIPNYHIARSGYYTYHLLRCLTLILLMWRIG